jgi:hypothetical protein
MAEPHPGAAALTARAGNRLERELVGPGSMERTRGRLIEPRAWTVLGSGGLLGTGPMESPELLQVVLLAEDRPPPPAPPAVPGWVATGSRRGGSLCHRPARPNALLKTQGTPLKTGSVPVSSSPYPSGDASRDKWANAPAEAMCSGGTVSRSAGISAGLDAPIRRAAGGSRVSEPHPGVTTLRGQRPRARYL